MKTKADSFKRTTRFTNLYLDWPKTKERSLKLVESVKEKEDITTNFIEIKSIMKECCEKLYDSRRNRWFKLIWNTKEIKLLTIKGKLISRQLHYQILPIN